MKETAKLELYKPKKGLIPTIKSALFGDEFYPLNETNFIQKSFFQLLIGSHSYNRKSLEYLVNSGTQNPVVYGIINKILFAQSNINFIPYKSGKPYKSATFDLDVKYATNMLAYCGTVFIWKKKVVGFDETLEVLNSVRMTETYIGGKFKYVYTNKYGNQLAIPEEDLIIIRFEDISACRTVTNFGLSPLQVALMPMEALEQMYIADTSALKNKGADIMITNDSDMPLVDNENETFDEAINKRVGGARKTGRIATSSAKLRVLNLGRTTKELALWDGYKIKLRDICNVFQVDSGQFNDPDNKKFSNVQDSNKALYNDCVIPLTKIITENKELESYLGYRIYLDTSNIDVLQEAQSLRMEKNKAIMDAIFEINQKLKDDVIDMKIAINILVNEFGYDEIEAQELIKIPTQM